MKHAPKVFESEYRFCLILWEHEPLTCVELTVLCREKLEWSRTTTYTVIKRLSERGVLEVRDSVVRSLYSKDQIQLAELDELLEKRFEGSLPAFIATFARRQHLSQTDVEEICKIIDRGGEEDWLPIGRSAF